MLRPEDENTKAKLEELILKTRAEIYHFCKYMLWIFCLTVSILACWVGKVQYSAAFETRDSGHVSFNEFDKNGDGYITKQEFEVIYRRLVYNQPLDRSQFVRIFLHYII